MRGLPALGVLVLLGCASLGAWAHSRQFATVPMASPARGPRPADRLDRNDECVVCHADIADEWTHSLHRQAFEDPMFQAALAHERHPGFCRSCHAPEADPSHVPSARAAAAGVACVTCHLVGRDDAVLASPRAGQPEHQAAGPDRPHALHRTAAFASADACAGCHEFWFPTGGRGGHELKMQRTITEHARSPYAADGCQTCHMPPARGEGAVHREHRFAVAGQVQMLRAAVEVDARRDGPNHVIIELWPRAVGHAVPTGDLFRRVVVELHTADDDGPVWSAQRVLGRRFATRRHGDGNAIRVELADERIGVSRGATVVEFELPAELSDRALRWVLVHERALDAGVGAGLRADVWDRTVFAEGEL